MIFILWRESLEKLTPAELFKVNYCQLFCGVYLASDAILPSGTHINKALFLGQVHRSNTQPGIKYPHQQCPDAASWKQWRRAIRLLFTARCSTDLRLLHPLGAWYPLRYDSQLWKYYRVDNTLIVRLGYPPKLIQYSLSHLYRRQFQYLKSRGQPIPALPVTSVPVDPPKQDHRYWLLPVSSGLDAVAPPIQPDPPVTFSERIAALNPSLWDLLSSVKLLLPIVLANPLLTLVGDGGAKTCRGSYEAVAASGVRRILTVQGPAAGPDPRSYRAEAYAMASLLLAVVILLESFRLPRPCQFAIHIFSDNQGLVNRIVKMKSWKTLYPSATLMPEWDLLAIILEYLPHLPSDPLIKHVKGHQDADAPVLTLPLPAQLNCEADAMATESLEAIPAPIPIVPVYPSAVCQLDVRDATTTRRYPLSLRWAAATPAMEAYLLLSSNDDTAFLALFRLLWSLCDFFRWSCFLP
jgi:hypothetical protein